MMAVGIVIAIVVGATVGGVTARLVTGWLDRRHERRFTEHTIWVCVDCYETHHGVREEWREPPDREPLCLLDESVVVVTAGRWPHEPDCPNVVDGEWVGEHDCDCERMEFSWSPCEGCGSTLGGAREALTITVVTADVQ